MTPACAHEYDRPAMEGKPALRERPQAVISGCLAGRVATARRAIFAHLASGDEPAYCSAGSVRLSSFSTSSAM